MPGLFQNFQQNTGFRPGQGFGRFLGGLATGGIAPMLRGLQGLFGRRNQDQFSATTTPSVPSFHEQLSAMTGGLVTGPNANLASLADQSGAVTGGAPGTLLNPRQDEIANLILNQFGVTSNQGFNAQDFLTNGRLDLTKVGQPLLQGLSADDRNRMRNANVLGSSLLTAGLPFSPPLQTTAATTPRRRRLTRKGDR
jgi:hypothetical protein